MSILMSETSEYRVNKEITRVALVAQVTCAFRVDFLASKFLMRGDQWSPASCKFTRWGIVSRFRAWASVSTSEPNSNPIRAAASSVGVDRRRFFAEYAAASDKEDKEGDVHLFPPSEACKPGASGG